MNAEQERYLRTWRKALSELLGWTDTEIGRWSQPFIKRMEGPNLLISESPMYYVARECASQHPYYDELSQRQRLKLTVEIEQVLKGGGSGWDFPKGYNFAGAKREIEKLLADRH